MPPTKIGEDSQFTIPLRSLIGLLVGTAVAVSAYVNISQEIHQTAMAVELLEDRISDVEEVIQASPLTPIRLQIENMNTRLKFLEGKSNE